MNQQTNTSQTIGKTATAGDYTYTWDLTSRAERGWECPRCGRINAPWVQHCDCSRGNCTITWTSDHIEPQPSRTGDRPAWWKEITCTSEDTFKIHPEDNPIYTTGGSDYWNPDTKTWENIPKDLRNSTTDGKHYQGSTYTCEQIKES